MSEPHEDLPATPSGISFDDWAALLTGDPQASGPALTAPSSPVPSPLGAAADPAPETPTDETEADASAAADAAAFEASWYARLNASASAPAEAVAPAPVEEVEQPESAAEQEPFAEILATWDAPAAPEPVSFVDDIQQIDEAGTAEWSAPAAPIPAAWPSPELPTAYPLPASDVVLPGPVPDTQTSTFMPPAPAVIPSGRRAAESASYEETPVAVTAVEPEPDVSTLNEAERERLDAADPDLVDALRQVLLQKASDMHLTVNAAPMLRVDGGLRPVGSTEPWDDERVSSALLSILSPEQKQSFDRELELDFAFTISANARFRVNYYKQRGSMGGAFRIIPTEIKQLGELGVPESVGRFSTLPRGLVLVTGPTGSGKSTTLAAMIDLVNRTRADHIVTVEDPIEFMHQHKMSVVNQREIRQDTHSFASALKHVLRQDPDVILIGELRDLETISVALTAAETGHLVFATLHTQDAPQTIDRVIDVFPPHQQDQVRAQLAATLQGVVCQTLVKHARGHGRVVATEVLVTTPAIANLIREGKTYQISSMMQAGRDQGMHTMDQHLADLVNAGKITRRAAEDKAHDRDGLDRLISRTESAGDASARAIAESDIDFGDSYSQAAR